MNVSDSQCPCVSAPPPPLQRPIEKLNITWKHNGVTLDSAVGSFGRRVTVINPTLLDAGQYVCEATLLDSSVKTAEARAFLSVMGKAPPSQSPHRHH